MMRHAALLVTALLLAACSSSDRVEGVVPAWVNPPQPSGAPPAAAKRAAVRSKAEPETHGATRPDAFAEE
jgi:hypothetical protein